MTKLMENKVGFITGAGSGIGRASALAFAREGAVVIVSDVNREAGEETVRLVQQMGKRAAFIHCDVSEEDQVKALVDMVVSEYGRLDWAHNNAGISTPASDIAESNTMAWKHNLSINLNGMYYLLKHEIRAMLPSGGGAIVNTSSLAGLLGVPGKAPGAASRWGLNGLTQTAALEYARHHIRVNAFCPGVTLTAYLENFFKEAPEGGEAMKKAIPMGRFSTPEEQANVAVWLCSSKASYITGVVLAVDGGQGLAAQAF